MAQEIFSIQEYKSELFKAIINNNFKEAISHLKQENYNFWEITEDNNFTGNHLTIVINKLLIQTSIN